MRSSLTVIAVAALVLIHAPRIAGHKPVTSKYTYNQDVFPIVRQRCAPCHVRGGPSPMSLMTFGDAAPWAESMREELTAERMPPWFVDPTGPRMRGAHTLSARELDVLLTWASGGAPEGMPNDTIDQVPPTREWRGGVPDLVLSMPEPHTLPPNIDEDAHAVLLPTGLKNDAWLAALDVRPGTASVVRSAIVRVQNGPVLDVWVPGAELTRAPAGTGFRLPAGAVLDLQIRYKKPWQEAQNAVTDRSTVGLYFERHPSVQAIRVSATLKAGDTLSAVQRIVAVRLVMDRPYEQAEVKAKRPDGTQVTLLSLRKPRPEWVTRYWLAEPVDLSARTAIEVQTTPPGSPAVELCGTDPSK